MALPLSKLFLFRFYVPQEEIFCLFLSAPQSSVDFYFGRGAEGRKGGERVNGQVSEQFLK